jgi:hypothetical protein
MKYDKNGNCIAVADIPYNNKNELFWDKINSHRKIINNSTYELKIGILGEYQKLIKTDNNGVETIIYNAKIAFILKTIGFLFCILFFVLIAVFTIKKALKNHHKISKKNSNIQTILI